MASVIPARTRDCHRVPEAISTGSEPGTTVSEIADAA